MILKRKNIIIKTKIEKIKLENINEKKLEKKLI